MIPTHVKGAALFREVKGLFVDLIAEDRRFIYIALTYGIAVSLLTLAVPVSVQMVVNTVANTASIQAIIWLASVLFILLLIYGILTALQTYVMELFERRFYARITSEFTLRCVYADHRYFQSINRYELVNRYFDIMNIQKIIPSIVIGLFSLVLQMLVGVLLVSFYHPWLFLFNACFVFLLWFVWRVWGYRALRTSIEVSDAKYETARHLEDVARANSFFKASKHIDHAIAKTDRLTEHYINERIAHFRHIFSQHIGLLLLYALASAGLLGIGGVLVVKGELTLGQLVAAELILSVVFYGVTRFGYYLTQLYEIGASFEEISRIFAVPLETLEGTKTLPERPVSVQFNQVHSTAQDIPIQLNFAIEPGQHVMIGVAMQPLQDTIIQMLKHYIVPDRGHILLGDNDILDYDVHLLRNDVVILDLATVVEATIHEYLQMSAPNATLAQMNDVLRLVELEERIERLSDGIHTLMTITGCPLSTAETLRLKLAAALLGKPHILVVNELFDMISYARRQRIFKRICEDRELTFLYFTNRKDIAVFDRYLFIGEQEQHYLGSLEALRDFEEVNDRGGDRS